MNDHRNSSPSEEQRENHSTASNTHPLLESLPRRNPTQVHVDSSVHRMCEAVPTSHTYRYYSKIFEIIERYGDGERVAELRKIVPSLFSFLTEYGLSHRFGIQMLRELSKNQRDRLLHQITRRIKNHLHHEEKEIALTQLELDCSTALLGPEKQEIALSQHGLKLDRIAKAKAKAKVKAKTQTKAENYDLIKKTSVYTIEKIIGLLPRYEKSEPVPSIANDMAGFNRYLCDDGSYGPLAPSILKYATPDQKKRFDCAIKTRRQSFPPKGGDVPRRVFRQSLPSKGADVPKGVFGVSLSLYKKPNLILEISRKFRNRTCSINDASSGYLSQSDLEKIVDEETGELTSLGEAVISGASEGTQAAIRANFRSRYQQPDLPPNSPPRTFFHPQEENLPHPSFFSGVSTDWIGMGYQPEPVTPQYPPQTQEENLPHSSFFSGVSTDWRGMDYQPEPVTPQYPPQSPASNFGGLSFMSHYGREFDLNTPQEEQPWSTYGDYGTQTPMGHSATPPMSPERIDVDNLPSPQDVADPELPQVTATSWLLDGHLHAYTHNLAGRLQGEPNAHLLQFADSQVVTMLNSEDEAQRNVALRRLVGDADNPAPPIVFIPINRDNVHWSLLVLDRRDNRSPAAYHYDSMGTPHPHQHWHAQMVAWRLGIDASQVNKMPTAIQPDGYSCGDHVLTGIEVLAHRVIDGAFDYAGGRDLSDIEPDRGLIRDRLAQAEQAPAQSSVRSVPEPPIEQKKKKSKLWKF
ncbi:Ulp1 family isopeptidase [Xanthomonas fragariae]|uniref:Ulp1 family isopeptidase n=1 Tax=Xanthomonas fragariae TaxID=48664 RepID=UPI0022AAC88E|nr:Ulp1 family isopeptidase [Xanthomonas fragariae]WAT15196.1 Ulp1 family isopeptidase [Xanthomonas fragariae]